MVNTLNAAITMSFTKVYNIITQDFHGLFAALKKYIGNSVDSV